AGITENRHRRPRARGRAARSRGVLLGAGARQRHHRRRARGVGAREPAPSRDLRAGTGRRPGLGHGLDRPPRRPARRRRPRRRRRAGRAGLRGLARAGAADAARVGGQDRARRGVRAGRGGGAAEPRRAGAARRLGALVPPVRRRSPHRDARPARRPARRRRERRRPAAHGAAVRPGGGHGPAERQRRHRLPARPARRPGPGRRRDRGRLARPGPALRARRAAGPRPAAGGAAPVRAAHRTRSRRARPGPALRVGPRFPRRFAAPPRGAGPGRRGLPAGERAVGEGDVDGLGRAARRAVARADQRLVRPRRRGRPRPARVPRAATRRPGAGVQGRVVSRRRHDGPEHPPPGRLDRDRRPARSGVRGHDRHGGGRPGPDAPAGRVPRGPHGPRPGPLRRL
ncbi:MAG: hypothetical protein AVDCRST_MAG54-4076, partial [uncultured Actinomycetospora sp.]